MKRVVKINESTIKRMVAETLRLLRESQEDDFNDNRWADTADDILKRYKDSEDVTYDDTVGVNDYKIDHSYPYFFTKEGKKVNADNIDDFHNDFAVVEKNGKFNYVKMDGVILSDEWFIYADNFESGFGVVGKMTEQGRKFNFINSDGEFLLPEWVDRAGFFMGDEAVIMKDGERHTIDREGNFLS